MKTAKIFSVLSFALIFATANTLFSAIPEKPATRDNNSNTVLFKVNVHLTTDQATCGTYQVRVLNADGSLAAAPQTYIPGVSVYMFTKVLWSGHIHPLYIWKTRITAVLVKVSVEDLVCPIDLVTMPDSKIVLYTPGQVINFDLYPNQIYKKNAETVKVKE